MTDAKSPPSEAHLEELGLRRWKRRDGDGEQTEQNRMQAAEEPASQETPQDAGNGHSESTLTLDPQAVHMHKWRKLRNEVEGCTRCELHRERKNTVFGVGSESARLMLIGEAPGADEDAQGEPFVGRAGKLLDSMLRAIGLDREQVFIANILKCRPPGNMNPTPEQAGECRGYLDRQIELIQPQVILALGAVAAHNLLGVETPIGKLRGSTHTLPGSDIPVVPTYHPAYLLRSPKNKAQSFKDLLFLCDVMEEQARTEPSE